MQFTKDLNLKAAGKIKLGCPTIKLMITFIIDDNISMINFNLVHLTYNV